MQQSISPVSDHPPQQHMRLSEHRSCKVNEVIGTAASFAVCFAAEDASIERSLADRFEAVSSESRTIFGDKCVEPESLRLLS